MNRIMKWLGVVGVVVGGALTVRAADIATVPASATVTSFVSISTSVRLVSNGNVDPAGALPFGSVSGGADSWSTHPARFVQFTIQDNSSANGWRLVMYTKNFPDITTYPPTPAQVLATTPTWGWSWGGLKATNNPGAWVPMGWRASTTTVNGSIPFSLGNPGVMANRWTFVVDRAAADNLETGDVEGYDSSYATVAVGNAKKVNVVNSTESGQYDPMEINANEPFRVYLEADCAGAAVATYATTLYFDKTNE